jgi:hypothetical protein
MEKIKGKKDLFMIKVSQTEIEIRRVKGTEKHILKENDSEYIWQYFNEIKGEWDYLLTKRSGSYNQYSQENLELQYQREHKFKRILKTN